MPPNSMPRRGIGMQRSVSSRLMEAERITTGGVDPWTVDPRKLPIYVYVVAPHFEQP